MYLTADFEDKDATILAIRELKAQGFGAEDLDVFSDEPVELPRGVLDRPSHMSLAAVTGALALCLLGIAFVYFTQHNYPLVTGGMPLFSFWATGVIFYELTMLGAIATTFLWFLWESGLLPRRHRGPVPLIDPYLISVRVRCRPDQEDEASRCLRRTGSLNLRKLEETR